MENKLAKINLLIVFLVVLILAPEVTAEVLLIKGDMQYLGWRQGDDFITCKGEKLSIEGGIVRVTSETCFPPPSKELDRLVVEAVPVMTLANGTKVTMTQAQFDSLVTQPGITYVPAGAVPQVAPTQMAIPLPSSIGGTVGGGFIVGEPAAIAAGMNAEGITSAATGATLARGTAAAGTISIGAAAAGTAAAGGIGAGTIGVGIGVVLIIIGIVLLF